MLSDNIFATFYIEQSDLGSCCGGQFCCEALQNYVSYLSLREDIFMKRNLWEKGANGKWQLSKINGINLRASENKLIFCRIYLRELKNISKFWELNFSNVTYEFIS